MQPKQPSLSEAFAQTRAEDMDLVGLAFTREDAPELQPGNMDIRDCTFVGCHIADSRFDHTGFQNVTFQGCDLSGCRFFEGGLKQVTFRDCRMLGAQFIQCTLNHVEFQKCAGRYLSLSSCTLKHCTLEESSLAGGALVGLKHQKTRIRACDLTGCDLRGTDFDGLNLSDSQIEGCTWTLEKLRGLTVNLDQAVELSQLLGIRIRP